MNESKAKPGVKGHFVLGTALLVVGVLLGYLLRGPGQAPPDAAADAGTVTIRPGPPALTGPSTAVAAAAPASAPGSGPPAPSAPSAPAFQTTADGTARLYQGTIERDQTVAAALGGHGVSGAQVQEIVGALRPVFDFRHARPGSKYEMKVRAGDGRVESFRFQIGVLEIYEADRDPEGKLLGRKVEVPTRVEVGEVGAEIRYSLYRAMQRAGEQPGLVAELVDGFAWDIDFYKDTRPGDRFKVIYEKVYAGDQLVRYGRILAAEYTGRVGTFRIFYFDPDRPGAARADEAAAPGETSAGYFLEDGRSARQTLLRSPLKFARVSSPFNLKRKHPILGYTRAHLGVDFAARTGTPVWAMASGTVAQAKFDRGYGNVVMISHRGGLMSLYAHLSKIAPGIKAGVKVEQKQIIGAVGSTGLSTGPHLHFGLKQNGRFINPLSLKMTRDAPVAARHARAFKQVIEERLAQLSAVKIDAAPEEPVEGEAGDVADDDVEPALSAVPPDP